SLAVPRRRRLANRRRRRQRQRLPRLLANRQARRERGEELGDRPPDQDRRPPARILSRRERQGTLRSRLRQARSLDAGPLTRRGLVSEQNGASFDAALAEIQ